MKHNYLIDNLSDQFARLPGVGRKSARRLAYFIVRSDDSYVDSFIEAMRSVKDNLKLCKVCFNLSEEDVCYVCSDVKRDNSKILVVENFQDLFHFEDAGIFNGLYHVLGGVLNPLDGVGPAQLKLEELEKRCQDGVNEVIIGLDYSVEGDSTSLYISDILEDLNIKVTRLAKGIPVGGEIEYTDELTLKQAFDRRGEV